MKTNLFASLENVLEKWLNNHCEDDEWPSAYVYDNQSRDMAKAAELVFDASIKGQTFLENNST